MKKYLYSALALPLLFACSTEEFEKPVVSNDQFAGIEQVDATFSMDEVAITRMDNGTGWGLEEGDTWGFAWMGDGTVIANAPADGKAYQNHNLIQTSGIFKPQTSIYVGKYYIYRPYDKTVVSPAPINFSVEEQPLAEGYESAKQPWKDLAMTAINIGDKWTDVTKDGHTIGTATKIWDKAGIGESYKIYGAVFSNQTGLDLTYEKNNPKFAAKTTISGATDITFDIAKDATVGAADIYDGSVQLAGAANAFTYAPTKEPNTAAHSGTFWANKKALPTATEDGFTFTTAAPITLTAKEPISTGAEGSKGWFWFNSLPVTAGDATLNAEVKTELTTSYGVVEVTKALKDCAYVLDKFNATATTPEWIKLVAGDASKDKATSTPKEWGFDAHNTFINQYGNHKGKYAFKVDFSTGKMNNMHIKDDAHLQKALKYYLASGKTETVRLNLDAASATDKTFKLSKISIALIQTINTTVGFDKVLIKACGTHGSPKIIITQDGQAELGLADKKEVPALNGVFQTVGTNVFLSKDCEWTWTGGTDKKTALPVDAAINSITNEGTLTVNATNVELSVAAATLANAAGATMNITQVTTVKNALTNLGTIEVGSTSNTTAELRAYDIAITNDATTLTEHGVINNYGVVGVSETGGTTGKFNNYGLIEMKHDGAITLLSTNELKSDFDNHFDAGTNKMGVVVLPENNPTAIVSVNNAAENGFIKYNWTGATYATPAGIVKYNTIVVSNDIAFTTAAPEVQYIEFNGTRTQVVNPDDADKLTQLKGIMVNAGKSIIIEKTNLIKCADGAYLGAGATVYKGGTFTHNANVVGKTASNYFGDWSTDQIVKY